MEVQDTFLIGLIQSRAGAAGASKTGA